MVSVLKMMATGRRQQWRQSNEIESGDNRGVGQVAMQAKNNLDDG